MNLRATAPQRLVKRPLRLDELGKTSTARYMRIQRCQWYTFVLLSVLLIPSRVLAQDYVNTDRPLFLSVGAALGSGSGGIGPNNDYGLIVGARFALLIKMARFGNISVAMPIGHGFGTKDNSISLFGVEGSYETPALHDIRLRAGWAAGEAYFHSPDDVPSYFKHWLRYMGPVGALIYEPNRFRYSLGIQYAFMLDRPLEDRSYPNGLLVTAAIDVIL